MPDRAPRVPDAPRRPWVMPTIVTVAVLLVVGGVVWAFLLGHLF